MSMKPYRWLVVLLVVAVAGVLGAQWLAQNNASSMGQVIAGSPLPPEVAAAAGPTLAPVELGEDGSRRRYLALSLLHEGDRIGCFAVGPYPAERESGVRRVAAHLAHLVDHLLAVGLEKVYASRMHTASMEDAYAELQPEAAQHPARPRVAPAPGGRNSAAAKAGMRSRIAGRAPPVSPSYQTHRADAPPPD